MSIIPRGISVLEFYRLYRTGRLLVNRQYQRKLVWTKVEKQALIDSVLQEYPIPLILLAEVRVDSDDTTYEIIDGMQRLNALFGFIENEFPLNDAYFDIKQHPLANNLAVEGVFEPVSSIGTNFLSPKLCAEFLEYQLPVSTFQGSQKNVNEVFGRINANGKHLSPQEVRQAGVMTALATLVRELSAEIRGDVSRDVLPLSDMPQISIDSRTNPLRYGVLAENTFWCSQGVLRVSQLRDSEDEQFIADLIVSVVSDEPFAASKEAFDDCYGKGDNEKRKHEIEKLIAVYGADNLTYDIKLVFDRIRILVESQSTDKNYLRSILNPASSGNPVKEPFYTMFMAFYRLMVKEGKEPFDYVGICQNLTGLASRIPSASNHIISANRRRNIDLTVGLIQDCFKASESPIRSIGTLALDFENYLRMSRVEAPRYDFKQGLYTLDRSNRKVDERSFEKIMHNISAMANLGKGQSGYLFIGVADKESDTQRIEYLDNITAPRVEQFGVVGLEREAKLKGVTLDQYVSFVVSKINQSQLPQWLIADITTRIYPITYQGHTILMFEVRSGNSPVWYGGDLYVRNGASCVAVPPGADMNAVFARFNS